LKAICAAAVLVWAARGADPPPSADEAALLVRGAREVAMSYARTLPDFECTQIVRREYRGPRIARRLLDVLTIRLTYHAQQDHHELLLVDGHKTSATYDSLVGATGEGEFGATLSSIFRPVGGAEFQWRSWTTHHGRPAAAFHYTMSRERGRYGMVFQSEQTGMLTATVGFRGEVVIDRDTFGILRLTYALPRLAWSTVSRTSAGDAFCCRCARRRTWRRPRPPPGTLPNSADTASSKPNPK